MKENEKKAHFNFQFFLFFSLAFLPRTHWFTDRKNKKIAAAENKFKNFFFSRRTGQFFKANILEAFAFIQ